MLYSKLVPELYTSPCHCNNVQARQRAELSATDAADKLKAYASSEHSRTRDGGPPGVHDKAMADLDASLMQRLEQDDATNTKLLEALKTAQVITRTCLCCWQSAIGLNAQRGAACHTFQISLRNLQQCFDTAYYKQATSCSCVSI